MTQTLRWMSAFLAGGFLMGCSSTSLYKEQVAPDFQNSRIHKVLVVSLSRTPEARRLVENEFVEQWHERGVTASASHDALPAGTVLEKSVVAAFAKTQGFDTVLVSRLKGVNKLQADMPGDTYDVSTSTADANLSDEFHAVVAAPEDGRDYELAVVTANVYDVSTEKKIWSGTTQTLVEKDLSTLIRDYVRVILKNIYR